jgi:ACS family hexuronate transporter-like MFS transporter
MGEGSAVESLPVSRSSRWLVVAAATLVMTVSYVDRQTLASLAPTVREALHISHQDYGTVIAAFSLAYLIGAPLAGLLLDRTGARRGLVWAVLAWSVVAAAHALVPTLGVLIAMRILLGIAEAPSFPGAAQSVKRILPPEHRSAGIGLLFTGSSIGAMFAAPLAIGLHKMTGDWRPAFFGTALVGLAWIPLWLVVTRSSGVKAALARDGAEARPVEAPSGLSGLVGAPVGRAVMLVVFVAPGIMFGLNWTAQYLADAFALTQDDLAGYLVFPPILFDAGATVFGVLASRADRRAAPALKTHTWLMAACGTLCASTAAIPLAHTPWMATVLTSLGMAGGGGAFAVLTADMLGRVHPSNVSAAGGFTAAAQSLAYMVASPLVGRSFDHVHSYAPALYLLGAMVPPAVLAWAVWPVVPTRALPPPPTPDAA